MKGNLEEGWGASLGLAAALVAALVAAPAAATTAQERLDQARSLYDEVEYEQAVSAFRAVVAGGDATPAQRVAALHGIASCRVALGEEGRAVDAYLDLLAIAPLWTPPSHLSPKVRDAFDAARDKDAHARVSLEVGLPAGGVAVEVRAVDPVSRVATVRVTWLGEPDRTEDAVRGEDGLYRAPVPPGSGPVRLTVQALNRFGFPVARGGQPDAPLVFERIAPPPQAPALAVREAPARPAAGGGLLDALGWTSLGLGAAVAGGGLYFGLQAQAGVTRYTTDPGSFASQDEALAFGDRTRTQSLTSGVLYGVGAAFLVGGVAMLLAEPERPLPAAGGLELTAVPTAGGGALFARVPLP